jgi:hypothetical protein
MDVILCILQYAFPDKPILKELLLFCIFSNMEEKSVSG